MQEQLQKGGPNNGVFLLVSADELKDIPLSHVEATSLGALAKAQAAASLTTRPLVSKVDGNRNRSPMQKYFLKSCLSFMGPVNMTFSVRPADSEYFSISSMSMPPPTNTILKSRP